MIRRAVALVAAVVAVVALGACDRGHDDWKPTAPFAPSLRPAFGARVVDGQLRIWTGSRCADATRATLVFRPSQSELELTAPQGKSADVERLTLGGPYPGLEVTEPLPDGFDWRKQESVDFWVDSEPASWGSSVNIAEVLKGSAEHPDDTYWFQDVGWLNPAEVAAQDGKTFLATCTPDPAKASSLPAAFGARVTDGKLRIWTGSPCAATTGVSLVFKPGQVDQVLTASDAAGVEFQHLTLGEPVPGLAVTKDLPDGFDWRKQQSLQLVVRGATPDQGTSVDLAEVLKGSAQHPDGTYWFQDVGWLDQAAVADKDGKTFLATCTPEPAKK